MYSIPQQAVTNGYWKIENFRAQPMASSRRVVKNDALLVISLPFQSAVVPGVHESCHYHTQKDAHLDQSRCPERAEYHRPRVEEDQFHIEEDKKNRSEVELDGELPDRQREWFLSALKRRQ